MLSWRNIFTGVVVVVLIYSNVVGLLWLQTNCSDSGYVMRYAEML